MKPTKNPLSKRVAWFSVAIAVCWTAPLLAQPQPGKAVVRAIRGTATYSTDGTTFLPLKTGAVLAPGTVIKTGGDSSVDLFLGSSAGVVRLIENSTLALDKLALTDTGADTVVEVQLNLPQGTLLFNVGKLSAASKYEIKVPNGVAGIRGTKGRISSNSYIVLLDGTLIFVYVPAGQQPTPYTLVAPPAVYFSPLEGVKRAPEDLIREVTDQFAAIVPGAPAVVAPPIVGPPGVGAPEAGAPPQTPTVTIEPTIGVRWGEALPLPNNKLLPGGAESFEEAIDMFRDPVTGRDPYPAVSPHQP
jgi:hypothetical protein